MVCDGPDPPESSPQELTPPLRFELMNGHGEDSDDDQHDNFGYEPLPQAPDAVHSDRESDDEVDETLSSGALPSSDVPTIEPMETLLTREVWSAPRPLDPIEMDSERAQQVMSAMANFALPQGSIPDWAQSIPEDQWRQTLHDRIEKIKGNR